MSFEIKVDRQSGWIIEAKVKQDMKGDVYLKGNAQLPEGMKVPMIMKNDLTYTRN